MEPGSTPAVTISELEAALAEIGDVRAARIIASPEGHIEEIHVLGLPGKSPKQLVRDVESCLMAGYGVAVDRRIISIAQIGLAEEQAPVVEVAPLRRFNDVREPKPEAEAEVAAARERVRIVSVNTDTDSLRTMIRVTLAARGLEVAGESNGPTGSSTRQRMVAEATLRAIDQLPDESRNWALEDCAITLLGGRQVAICSIVTATQEGEQAFAGSALVRHTTESATVRATLDALNRRIGL